MAKNKNKAFTVEVLKDGRVRIDCDDMSGPIHTNAEGFSEWMAEDCGTEAEITVKKKSHTHAMGVAHSHKHGHTHKH